MKTAEVIEHITQWLERYAKTADTKGFVVGVSGGIDSAVSSTLAARTALPVLCVEMPIYQSQDHVTRAQGHIAFLREHFSNVTDHTVELTTVFDQLIEVLPAVEDAQAKEWALVNVRARLRMTTLYYFAALHNYLVVGTGNRVEDFGIGFFTKYGDGGVDLSPIADLTKTEVYEVGTELGVIETIMKAAPADGLWDDNRTDEDQIGATYPELEWAMDFTGDESSLSDRQRQVLEIYRSLHDANQHKMVPIPVCVIPAALR